MTYITCMMQVLDYFRQLYKNETGYEISTDPTVAQRRFPPSYVLHNGVRERIGEYESHPTWEYVRWLESRLSKCERISTLSEADNATTTHN